MKRVLITGASSYIGQSFKSYLSQWPEEYDIESISTRGLEPKPELFKGFDVIFCTAGIAHMKETSKNRHLFFDVNRDLVVSIAKAAKMASVKHFILLSSMSVYGLEVGHITKETTPKPNSSYGKSKLEADNRIAKFEDKNFYFCCLRPPMVYGKNCKGNYQVLRRFAIKSPVFPDYMNYRSMIYIDNLCEFVKSCIDKEKSGLFFPQNAEYTNTSEMVRLIAECNGKTIRLTKAFNWAIEIAPVDVLKKVFGSLTYEAVDTVDLVHFSDSITATETLL